MTRVVVPLVSAAVGAAMVLVAYKTGYEKGVDAALLATEPMDPAVEAALLRHPSSSGKAPPIHLLQDPS